MVEVEQDPANTPKMLEEKEEAVVEQEKVAEAVPKKEEFVFQALTTEQIINDAHENLLKAKGQAGLMPQDPDMDISKITPLNPEIISR